MASARIQRKSKQTTSEEARVAKANNVPHGIQCKICNNRYENPKLLPCLHTFCKDCLGKSFEKYGVLYCPSCPGEINSSDIDSLPNDLLVSNLLQVIDLKQGVESKVCENCDERGAASSRCFECSDFLCENCVEAHKRVRFTKQHRVVSVKNLNPSSLSVTRGCTTHAQEAVKMYCRECQKLVCRTCILHDHNDHVLVSLGDALEDTKPKLNTLLVATRAKIPILQRKLKEVHASKDKLETKIDEVIKGIQGTSARILMAVKRREKDLYRMLRRIHDRKSDELAKKETDLQNELAQVLDSCEFTDELLKQENDVAILNASEITYTRLKNLGGKDIIEIPEIEDNEIEYTVNEKPIIDELRIYGKIMSKEDREKKNIEAKAKEREKRPSVTEECGTEKDSEKKTENGKASVERRPSWLETIINPRALLRRLSFSGDNTEESRPTDTSTGTSKTETKSGTNADPKTQPAKQDPKSSPKHKQNVEIPSHSFSDPQKDKNDKRGAKTQKPNSNETKTDSSTKSNPSNTKENQEAQNTTTITTGEEVQQNSDHTNAIQQPAVQNNTNESPYQNTQSELPSTVYESPKTHSILKQPNKPAAEQQSPYSSEAWTIPGASRPSGAHKLSYLPTLNMLTKNRRGRPREVEIQLESPDNSIISAQILDHKNGTYTIFYCPLTPGEHNLYVNVVGKNIKHGKRVLNFYGKFGSMGAEELFLTRRALSCIRWQVTPGFVEVKNSKITANPDI